MLFTVIFKLYSDKQYVSDLFTAMRSSDLFIAIYLYILYVELHIMCLGLCSITLDNN